MTNEERARMFRKKREFIRLLEKAIKADKVHNDVRSVKYIHDPDGVYRELIIIEYEGGGLDAINTARNSNGANAREVIHAIYGGGKVVGLISHYKKSAAGAAQFNDQLKDSTDDVDESRRGEINNV